MRRKKKNQEINKLKYSKMEGEKSKMKNGPRVLNKSAYYYDFPRECPFPS